MVDLKTTWRGITLVYLGLVTVLVSFLLIVYFINVTGPLNATADQAFTQMLRYVLFVVLPLGLGAGFFLFKQLMSRIPAGDPLKTKLMKYQQAILIRAACFELPGLFGGVAALLSGDNTFLLFTALIAAMFLVFRPGFNSLATDLHLSPDEIRQLEGSGRL